MTEARRRFIGFTLIEVVVALAVLLILAAVALPQLTGYLDQKRIEETAAQLAIVRDALYKTGGGSVAFRQTVGANAGRLSQLTTPLVSGDLDSCGDPYSNGERSDWPDEGPYLNFMIERNAGMATPVGQADDLMTRLPANGGGPSGSLRLNFTNTVSLSDAEALDLFVDGVAGWNAGTVQWTPQGGTNGVVTLHYDVIIDNRC